MTAVATLKKHTLYGAATVGLKELVCQIGKSWQTLGGQKPLAFKIINPGGPSQVAAQLSTLYVTPGSVVVCMTHQSFIHAAGNLPKMCPVVVLDSPLELSRLPYILPTDYNPENPWQLLRPEHPFDWWHLINDMAGRVQQPEAYEYYTFHRLTSRTPVGLEQAIDLTGLDSGGLLSALADLTTINSLRLRTMVRRVLAEYLLNRATLDQVKARLEDSRHLHNNVVASSAKGSALPAANEEELSQPAIRHLIALLQKHGHTYKTAMADYRAGKKKVNKSFNPFEINFLNRLINDELELESKKGRV